MKNLFLFAIFLTLLATSLYGQTGSINNTLGTGGSFNIKDGSATFLTLSQSTGYLSLNKSFTLLATTGSTLGVIFKGADRFIHDYKAPGTNGINTFVGVNSGNFTMSGSTVDASFNTAVGSSSLYSLTAGRDNSAFGVYSLVLNTSGSYNCAFGSNALSSNITGGNNSAFGVSSLLTSTGSDNSAFGQGLLYLTNTGSNNCAFGSASLLANTTGNSNSAFGRGAGSNVTTGSNNTIIGYSAQVPSATSDNQVRIGNTSVSYAGVQVAWTVTSDRRWKSNITQSDLGLDFILKLEPVAYTRKNDEKHRTEYGFIAQDIEGALKDAGVRNAGMLTVDDEGRYELRYNDLLAPIVKAIQELKAENDALKNEVAKLRSSMAEQVKKDAREVLPKAVQANEATTKVSLNETRN